MFLPHFALKIELTNFHLREIYEGLQDNNPDLVGRVGIFAPQMYAAYRDTPDLTDEERYLKMEAYVGWDIFKLDYLIVPINVRDL